MSIGAGWRGGAVAALLVVWTAPAGRADERGRQVLAAALRTLHAARTYSAALEIRVTLPDRPGVRRTGTLVAMKPGYLKVLLRTVPPGQGTQSYVADSRHYYAYVSGAATFQKTLLPPDPTEFLGQWECEIDGFFGGEKLLARKGEPVYLGAEVVDGTPCDLVRLGAAVGGPGVVYAVGQRDHLIRRAAMTFPARGEGPPPVQTNLLTRIRLNTPRTRQEFAFRPPAGVTEFGGGLVAVGKTAPEFTLPTLAGGQASLSEARKRAKAVLINFWVYN